MMSGRQLDEVIALVKKIGNAEAKVRSEAIMRNSGAVNVRNSSLVEFAKPILEEPAQPAACLGSTRQGIVHKREER